MLNILVCFVMSNELFIVHKIFRRLVRISESRFQDILQCPAGTHLKDELMLAQEESSDRTQRLYLLCLKTAQK